MKLPNDTLVAVCDGENLKLFRARDGEEHLTSLKDPTVSGSNHSGGTRHGSSAGNPDEKQDSEDMFAAAAVEWLNKQAMANHFEHAVIIAAPKALGEMRKHYHKTLEAKILKEIDKDLAGQSLPEIEKALHAA